jgi:hypothetical protein
LIKKWWSGYARWVIWSSMAQAFQIPLGSRIGIRDGINSVLQSRRAALALNQARRAAGIGNYWFWAEVPEQANGIEIASIVCPLRYDVLVRRDFVLFYATHRDLYDSDPNGFIALTKRTSYYTWYLESEAVRTNKRLRGNAAALDQDLHKRIGRVAALYESVQKDGFSSRFPITLKTARHILPPTTDRGGPPTGKQVSAKYFLADGCHRLALLMTLGYQKLPASYFRVKCYQEFSPFDSTSLLARRLMPEPSAYFAFLSTYYTAPVVLTNRNDFLGYIRNCKPAFLEEVLSVIRADGFDIE